MSDNIRPSMREVIVGVVTGIFVFAVTILVTYPSIGELKDALSETRKRVQILESDMKNNMRVVSELIGARKAISNLQQNQEEIGKEITTIKNAMASIKQRQVSISGPVDNGQIICDSVEGNQCFFTVRGSSVNLQDGDFVSVMLQIAGGETWWQGSRSLEYGNDFTDNWVLSMLSVDPNGFSRQFNARVIVTDAPHSPGQNFRILPPSKAQSPVYNWTLQ